MRLFELVNPTFYLMCHTKQAEGSVAQLQGGLYPLGEVIEAVLEDGRPEGSLSCIASLYLSDRLVGSAEFAYFVQPVREVERNHTGWLRMLASVDPKLNGVRRHYASGYWGGGVCREAPSEPWEYRTLEVKIIRRVGGSSRG